MDQHPEPALEPFDEDLAAFDEEPRPARPAWWRWMAVLVVVALVAATPFAYVLSRVLR